MLDKLVGFPTVSDVSNLELIDWVEDYLASHGVRAHRVYSDDGTKANLYANVGPEVEGGVVLSGHTDVVPVAGQPGTPIRSRWSRRTASSTAVAPVT